VLETSAYLDRIGYSGPTAPTAQTLRAIHRAHMLAVPFENLDIGCGRKIELDEDEFVRKVVERRRGGFCYELNGAFAALLRALGFRVTLLSAAVARPDGSRGPEFDHLLLQVDLEQPWIADVGFGDSFLEPLLLSAEIEQPDPAGKFRFLPVAGRMELQKSVENNWTQQYSFGVLPRGLRDFAAMCQYHQTSPESHFTQNRICSRALPDGRVTLSGMNLIVTRSGRREERMLASDHECKAALREHFGMSLEAC
jgi:N-hydroxyarylamine O-acetyltransferase